MSQSHKETDQPHETVDEMVTGECFCGEITFEVAGELFDARSCHCSRCRKAFSGSGSAYALVPPDAFKWTAGEQLLSSYVSQEGAGLQFCSQCGSTLCGVWQGQVNGVTLGCVNGEPDVRIERHIFTGSKAGWDEIGGGAPQHDGWPKEAERG